MLIDAKMKRLDPGESMILAMLGAAPVRMATGIYAGCGFNFANCVDMGKFDDCWSDESDPVPSCGVADSIEQFIYKFGAAIEASRHGYSVGFTEVRRADQDAEGGWRWDKWGEYIGEHEPKCEYLHDEPEIEVVVVFTVLRTKAEL